MAARSSRPSREPSSGRPTAHSGTASLGRDLKPGSTLSVRYKYQLYERTDLPRDESHVVGLAFTRTFGRATSFSLFGGARFAAGEVRPDAAVTLGHAWRSSQTQRHLRQEPQLHSHHRHLQRHRQRGTHLLHRAEELPYRPLRRLLAQSLRGRRRRSRPGARSRRLPGNSRHRLHVETLVGTRGDLPVQLATLGEYGFR